MPRPERPVDPSQGPVHQFATDLRALRKEAGNPPYREMAKLARFSKATLSAAARGHRLPTWEVTRAYVKACQGDVDHWHSRWMAAHRAIGSAEADLTPTPQDTYPAQTDGRNDRPPARARRRRRLIAAVLAGAAALTLAISTAAIRSATRTASPGPTPALVTSTEAPASYTGGKDPVADNADPKKSGCADDPSKLITLDKVQINTRSNNLLGEAQLRHSPTCHASWGRFEPSARLTYLRNGTVNVTITARRPSTRTTGTPYSTPFDGQPVFGNILLDPAGCVEITVVVDAPDGGGSATTACKG